MAKSGLYQYSSTEKSFLIFLPVLKSNLMLEKRFLGHMLQHVASRCTLRRCVPSPRSLVSVKVILNPPGEIKNLQIKID